MLLFECHLNYLSLQKRLDVWVTYRWYLQVDSITRYESQFSFSKDEQNNEQDNCSNEDWSLYLPHLLVSGPNPKATITNLLYENHLQQDLLEDIKCLEKEIEDLETDLSKLEPQESINTQCQYQEPIKLDFSGVKPSCYRSCIACLRKRDVYPEVYGHFYCTCTSEVEVQRKKNSFGFISCICNAKERPIFG